MPTDPASLASLIDAINVAGKQVVDGKGFRDNAQRQQLIQAAVQLVIAAREPEENLYATATQTAQNAAIRSAIEMGAFEAVSTDGKGISAEQLAEKTGVEKNLVVRIMRACTSTNMFVETGEEHYAHNPFSLIFTKSSNRDMFRQMYDFTGKGVYALSEFLARTGWKNPTDYNDSAFHYGHRTKLGLWEYINEDPERLRTFNNGMRSLATIGAAKSAGPYPFSKELVVRREDEVVLVDVGGGRGQALEAIKNNFPALKGKMVLQDLHNVIEDAKTGGLPTFIEPQVHSFFAPQPVKGAHAYHFRRIFHDWDDEKSLEILCNTTPAMAPFSKILIADTVVPNIRAPRDLALQDLNMMSFGGLERTERQWQELLNRAGLRLVKIWRSDDDTKHGLIEAMLKVRQDVKSSEGGTSQSHTIE